MVIFFTFLTLWQSDEVVWTTWNLDRMCARYSYLKLKICFKIFSKNFLKIFFSQKNLFSKFFFSLTIFFLRKKGPGNFFLILLFKNHFWPKVFLLLLRYTWRPGSIVYLSCSVLVMCLSTTSVKEAYLVFLAVLFICWSFKP